MAKGPVPPENCIRFLEGKLKYDKWMLEPSTTVILESIVEHLKKIVAAETESKTG